MTGVIPLVFKTAKTFPVFKKDSKLDYHNFCPTSLLSNVEKILEKYCIPFSITIILSITCSLDSDNNILHLMP